MFPEIEAVALNIDELLSSTNESDFVGYGVDLLVESASYLTICCSIYPDERGWTLPQAIIGGNGVRSHKLIQGYLDATCQHRREISEILSRLIFETSTNIVYLVNFTTDELIKSYLDYSLKYERKLKIQIEKRIRVRGVTLPIEDRMLASIGSLADASGIDLNNPPLNKRNWGDKDLFQKAELVGWGDAYLGVFAGMSGAVHGNWGDIATHHLERFDGSGFYKPCFDWSMPRPQSPYAIARMIVCVCDSMLAILGGSEVQEYFAGKLDDIIERLEKLTELHELFLARMDFATDEESP